MKPDWRTVSKWLLLVPTIVFSTLAAYIFIEFSTLDEFAIKSTSALHINSAPSLILRAITLLTVFLAISLWVLPPALAIGFALRARWLSCLQWGFTISFLLLGAFAWTSDATIPNSWGSCVRIDTSHCGRTRLGSKTLAEQQTHNRSGDRPLHPIRAIPWCVALCSETSGRTATRSGLPSFKKKRGKA